MQINFYILSENRQLIPFVCQLVKTILSKTDKQLLILANADSLPMLDDTLWQFEETSFIPHDIVTADNLTLTKNSPVILTDNLQLLEQTPTIIINLTTNPISTFHGEKLLEIIDSNPANIEKGREKYRHYQQSFANIPIQTFKIA